jgi:hypothetical protein
MFCFVTFALLDPDPADQSQCGSGSSTLILPVPWCRDLTDVMKANMLASKLQEKPSDVKREHPALHMNFPNFFVIFWVILPSWIRIQPTNIQCGSGSSTLTPCPLVHGSDGCDEGEPVLRIHMFLGHPDPDPLVRGMDPDPSIIMQK